ncbi:MAG: hypothetical protein ACOX42_07120 [Clostridia bacterium]
MPRPFAYVLLGELLTPRQLVGCALILAGMLAAELKPALRLKKSGDTASGKKP